MGILTVTNVNNRFGGLKALDDVNLDIHEATVHAIIGPNGAGKSTLLNCFVGKLEPDTGSVVFDGKSLLGIQPHEINQLGVSRANQQKLRVTSRGVTSDAWNWPCAWCKSRSFCCWMSRPPACPVATPTTPLI